MADQGTLAGRRVVLYVSGSIAAYKACEVVTSLRKLGAEVRVAMTDAGARFVSPMTFQSLSGNPVEVSVWDTPEQGPAATGHGMGHIATAEWAEVQVACPASANLVARLALGLADDVVTTTALACTAPLILAPAMETQMWEHPATRAHIAALHDRGAVVVGPVSGRLASGHEGAGRMAEPAAVVDAVVAMLSRGAAAPTPEPWLHGHRVVITAGGTREPIDPVRYIGNRSSGKMGTALAHEALRLGALVTLVTAAPPPAQEVGLDVVEVATAAGMLDAVRRALPGAAALVMAAAVADYRPAEESPRKIKKRDGHLDISLVPTVDVLAALRDDPARGQAVVVGFAAETDDLVDNARRKLAEKGLDLIIANDVGADGIGMGSDDNAVTILGRDGVIAEVDRSPKPVIARAVFEAIRRVAGTRLTQT
jgi:phosphopantothenoylcysteine decarboxylase/phosphopantothenate--cysteine ligase